MGVLGSLSEAVRLLGCAELGHIYLEIHIPALHCSRGSIPTKGALFLWIWYIQVLTISNIADAAVTHILPEVRNELPPTGRHSTLNWIKQQKPPSSDWSLWRIFLQYFTRNHRPLRPLAPCYNHPTNKVSGFMI